MTNSSEVEDVAGEIQIRRGARPQWLTILAYLLVLWGLGYLVTTAGAGGLAGPNRIFLIVLAIWVVYTPIATRKKWFAIRL